MARNPLDSADFRDPEDRAHDRSHPTSGSPAQRKKERVRPQIGQGPPLNGSKEPKHPVQEAVFRLIDEQPGLNIREVAHLMGLPRGTVRYHIRKLIDRGHLVTTRQGHHVLHFSSTMPKEQQQALSLLRVASVRSIVETAVEDPKIDTAQLAAELGLSTRSVQRSIRMLTKSGMATDHHARSGDRSVRVVDLHPVMRVTWVRWCEDQDRDEKQDPLWRTPGWLFSVELYLLQILGGFFIGQ